MKRGSQRPPQKKAAARFLFSNRRHGGGIFFTDVSDFTSSFFPEEAEFAPATGAAGLCTVRNIPDGFC